MTQLRKYRDAISNYFDELEKGIGKRGSSFMDIDAVSHNADTGCFLFREFKEEGEALDKGQSWTLRELSKLPRCTVWLVRRLNCGRLGFAVSGKREEVISEDEYRNRLRRWWGVTEPEARPTEPSSEELRSPIAAHRLGTFDDMLANDRGPMW